MTPDELRRLDNDLCIIMGNLLENAIEACNRIDDDRHKYININSSIDIPNNDVSVYNDETIVDVTFNSYELKMNNVEVSNIMVNLSDTGVIFTGNINNLSTDKYSLVIKLFNANGESIGQSNNDFSTEDKFDVKFDYNDSIKKEDIKKYSISIKR